VQGFGARIQFSPSISPESAGGPLLDSQGKVTAILGGSVVPASRFDGRNMTISPKLGIVTYALSAATPVSAVAARISENGSPLAELAATGNLTAALSSTDALLYVATAAEMTKAATDPLPRDMCEFSRRDKQVWVISEWIQRGKISKGLLSGSVWDEQNRLRVKVEPKKTSLSLSPLRTGFGFVPAALEPGIYRVDVIWDGQPVWRTFIRITE
jgi:hypothetical protein